MIQEKKINISDYIKGKIFCKCEILQIIDTPETEKTFFQIETVLFSDKLPKNIINKENREELKKSINNYLRGRKEFLIIEI